jgi:hypothetical protein
VYNPLAGAECLALSHRALAAYEAAGRDDSGLGEFMVELGWRHYYCGGNSEAESLCLRALAMQERLLGPGLAHTGPAARTLAMMYDHRRSDFARADAEPFYRKAVLAHESDSGDEAAGLPDILYRLGDNLHREGRDEEAAPVFERLGTALEAHHVALERCEFQKLLGVYHAYLSRAGREAEIDEAALAEDPAEIYREMRQATVEHAEAVFGADSLELAEAFDKLAMLCIARGMTDQAEAAPQRALEIREARLGPTDPATIEAARRRDGARGMARSLAAQRGIGTGEDPMSRVR